MKENIQKIIEAGRLSPSADNSQPWFFTVEENAIYVHHDVEHTAANHLYNIDFFADYVSLGAVIENMHVQAHHLGYTPEINFFESAHPIAKIELKKTHDPYSSDLLDSLAKRKTNRRAYSTKKIARDIKNKLQALAEAKGAHLCWIEDPQIIKQFSRIIGIHDYILWGDKALRDNLLRMVSFEKNEQAVVGLPLESLELGLKKHFFKPTIYLAEKIKLLWKVMGVGSVIHTSQNVKRSGALAFITYSKDHHPHTYLGGGRAMQAIWLYLTTKNIFMQPLFGTLCLILNQRLSRGGLSPKYQRIQNEIADFFHATFPNLKNETPVALFRLGYAKGPSAVSGRKAIEKIMKNV
ncbi:MAG: nitroreductase family protein [Candidatus Moraniibacteriota bacterium]